jgi:hypothetical protein
MRLRLAAFIFLLLCASLPAADQLRLRNKSLIDGTLLSLSPEACVFADRLGRTAIYRGAVVTRVAANATAPRWARFTDKNGTRILRVLGIRDGALRCQDAKDKQVTLRPKQDGLIELYTAATPARLLKVPHVKQKPDYCGEACIEMVTSYFGESVSQDRANELAGLNGARGVYGSELVKVIDKGLKLETAGRVGRACKTTADDLWDRVSLVRAVSEGRPVLLGFWGTPEKKNNEDHWAFDHFVLLVGYDLAKGIFLIHDPGLEEHKAWQVKFSRFPAHRRNKFGGLFHIEFPPWRTWTRSEKKLRAQFVAVEDGHVRLRDRSGRNLTVPLKELSKADLTAIERLRGN